MTWWAIDIRTMSGVKKSPRFALILFRCEPKATTNEGPHPQAFARPLGDRLLEHV